VADTAENRTAFGGQSAGPFEERADIRSCDCLEWRPCCSRATWMLRLSSWAYWQDDGGVHERRWADQQARRFRRAAGHDV